MKRKICVFIGGRANYSSIKSAMQAIQAHPELTLQVILAGAGLIDKYGDMEKILTEDGFPIDERVYMQVEGDKPNAMVKTAGLGMLGLADAYERLQPDFVIVVGDRYEVMAATIAAAYMNIRVAHTMGGEVTGTIDESIRHAITKFAHVHFPANKEAAERIIKLGERTEDVFTVGCPRIDNIKRILDADNSMPMDLFEKEGGVGPEFDLSEPFILVSQHPVTTEYTEAKDQITQTINACMKTGMNIVMLWPNSDAGSEGISTGIRRYREKYPNAKLHVFKNMPIKTYVRLMANTACLVGNSSSGIREGAFIGTPVVNVGTRQNGRERGVNVIDAADEENAIYEAIQKQLAHGKYDSEPIYGDGHAGERIADILSKVEVPVQKMITY
ncbi:UDP-N-acetylglucosamine 2-epimerase/UDP-N-acetyl-D-glucosamine 2-epimerase, UDP-hydrolysing,TIGR03568 [Lachnospiraceae bacterium KH1T2]|nr:UDP-N-acetylglucosamine 2-epimerase/UDP-N-acetyl-D-glucosamine 2-epimerase, UDP-hydrolysing,TIGR03568 [Lachnospiraceae bacterium KH1T2]